MMDKIWVEKDGWLGTAHLDRNGRVADFRPSPGFVREVTHIYVEPPRGQERLVKPLHFRLDGLREVLMVDFPRKGMRVVRAPFLAEMPGDNKICRFFDWEEYCDMKALLAEKGSAVDEAKHQADISLMRNIYIWSIKPEGVPQRLARELAVLKGNTMCLRFKQRDVLSKILKIIIREKNILFNGRWISDADIQCAVLGMPPARLDELVGRIKTDEERRRAKFEEQG